MTTKDTRIIVKKTTRATLKDMKRGGESYDKIINRLIRIYKEAGQ